MGFEEILVYIFVHVWPWTTKPVISVNFSKFKFKRMLNKWAFHWCMVCYDSCIPAKYCPIWKSGIWVYKNQNTEKIDFKIVHMKFLTMHITGKKLLKYIYGRKYIKYLHGRYPNDFWHKRKIDNFDPYNAFLAIATNILQRLKTGFVLQGHIYVLLNISINAVMLMLHFKKYILKSV